jgi:hypothetical protein
MTWFTTAGALVTSSQLGLLKSEFFCRTKSAEGHGHEMTMFWPETARFNDGGKGADEVKIPPPNLNPLSEVATDLLPSLDAAIAEQF